MNNINHYRLVPARVNYWGEIVGNINDQKDLIDYISTHGGGSVYWGEIGGNINDQEDLQELVAGYATESWVSTNFLSTTALTGYATQSWVSSQQFATQSWVSSQGYYKPGSSETVLYTIQPTDINPIVPTGLIIGQYQEGDYVEGVELNNGGAGLMKHYYNGGGEDYFYAFLTESNVSLYLDGYATESWVESQGYLTSVPAGYATESWVSTNFLTSTALTGYATESYVQGVASGLTSSITALETSVNTEFSSVYDRLSTIESNLGTALNITNQILG